jgi:hypothetical protein
VIRKYLNKQVDKMFGNEGYDCTDLEIEDYNVPLVTYFGQVPDEREEFVVEVDQEFVDYFEENIELIFTDVCNSHSYTLVDENNLLSDDHIRVIDHLYGILHQIESKENDRDHQLTPLGLLSVQSKLEHFDDNQFLGDVVFSEHVAMMEQVGQTAMKMTLLDVANGYENAVRTLVDFPNIRYIAFDSNEQGYYPWINYDCHFSGQIGFWRLQKAAERLDIDFGISVDGECKKVFREYLEHVEKTLDMFSEVMEQDEINRVKQIVKRKRNTYATE